MDIEQQIKRVANRYFEQGYEVVVHPGPDALPPFAKDFKVEVLARRTDGNVLASVMASSREFQKDRELSRYADVIAMHTNWRYDVFALGPSEPSLPDYQQDATELTDQQITDSLDAAERLDQLGFAPQAVIAAWAAAESAIRHRIRAQGGEAVWGATPRVLLNELLSTGALSSDDYRRFLDLSHLRNVIVHGFAVPEIDPSVVPFLTNTTRRLLADAQVLEQAS
jgi:HEPN domain-containing protein